MTTSGEIANMAAFLPLAKPGHTTGQIIYVGGGYVHLGRALANAYFCNSLMLLLCL